MTFAEEFISAYYNETTLHPVGLIAVLLLGGLMIISPRRYAILPMIMMACFIAPAQRVAPLGLDFNLLRLMVLSGWIRVIVTGEYRMLRWKALDTIFCAWALSSAVIYTLLHGTNEALINRSGFLYDALGMYFLFRILVREWDDIFALARGLVVISVPVAAVLVLERLTGRNSFAIFGGVPEETIVRQGQVRARGAFAHSILAGTFWAALSPLMIALLKRGLRGVIFGTIGLISTCFIVWACASTTPIIAMIIAFLAVSLIIIRNYLGWVRLSVVVGLVLAHLVMVPPVWHLIARMNFVPGSTGYYRYKLIDGFFNHFNEWWLIGTRETTHWWTWGASDLTNQYVLEGVNGGLLTLVLFIAMIVVAFRNVRRIVQKEDRRQRHVLAAWAVGSGLFVHICAFMSVSYFGQIIMPWYLALALTASLAPIRVPIAVRRRPVSERRGIGHVTRSHPVHPTVLPAQRGVT